MFLVVDEKGAKGSKLLNNNETNKFEDYDKPTQRMEESRMEAQTKRTSSRQNKKLGNSTLMNRLDSE